MRDNYRMSDIPQPRTTPERRTRPLGGGYGEPPTKVSDLEAWARGESPRLGSPN